MVGWVSLALVVGESPRWIEHMDLALGDVTVEVEGALAFEVRDDDRNEVVGHVVVGNGEARWPLVAEWETYRWLGTLAQGGDADHDVLLSAMAERRWQESIEALLLIGGEASLR
ncbi:MAG: hypothetical protein KTR31_28740 [Myxococcales bacterium]|nr:hypothetical protein [Myxococcales bacterium]